MNLNQTVKERRPSCSAVEAASLLNGQGAAFWCDDFEPWQLQSEKDAANNVFATAFRFDDGKSTSQ